MHLGLTSELEDFRQEVRAWLAANVPREPRPRDGQALLEYDVAWQRTQYEGGWAGIDWPADYGGQGLSLLEQVVWYEELVRADAPKNTVLVAGLNQMGRSIMAFGSEEQKRHYLPRILSGQDVWSQGFSEPDAGSDLASLRTRAKVEGDELVISGQKIWSTNAQYANLYGALVRTDPELPRHKGLSWVVVELDRPGIEIRPIETLDGGADFCEVFLEDVRVPMRNVVGGLNEGWKVAMGTLSLERGPTLFDQRLRLAHTVVELIGTALEQGRGESDELMHRLAMARARAEAVRAMVYQLISDNSPGNIPGAEGLSLHVFQAHLRQEVARLGIDVNDREALEMGRWTENWLWHFGSTLGGGSVDIQRNLIAERALGLPR
jgi:alkylation response protein AidB-like acyl-CoA dehydrogenase